MLHRNCRLARTWSSNTLPNPITDTVLPERSLAATGPAVVPPLPRKVRRLLSAARDDRDPRVPAFARLVTATGMRRGEACALRRDDVDWEGSAVRIDEALVTFTGGVNAQGTKTRASVGGVAVDASTLGELRRLHDYQVELAAVAEVKVGGDGLVFSCEPRGRLDSDRSSWQVHPW